MNKPQFLYHGSNARDLKEFHPRQIHYRNIDEGPLVYATSDRAHASIFMSPRKDDSWTRIGNINGINYIVISDEQRFKDGDVGGSIYVLPSETFFQTPGIGMKTEWTSKDSVCAREEISYVSTITAMVENGVRVYFVSREEFESFTSAPLEEMFKMMEGWKHL